MNEIVARFAPMSACPVCVTANDRPLAPVAVAAPAQSLCPACAMAIARTVASRYSTGLFTPASFARRCGMPAGSPAYFEQWARFCHTLTHGLARFAANHAFSGIFAMTRDGGIEALAVMRILYGYRDTPIGSTIGDPASSLGLHVELRRFSYPPESGLDPALTPESALAEFGRLVVTTPQRLLRLVEEDVLTPEQRAYIERRGFDEILIRAHRFDSTQPAPPCAYIFAIKPRHWHLLRRFKGLNVIPLFGSGAEPTAAACHPDAPDVDYYTRWPSELATVAPEYLECGIADAVAHLATQDPKAWRRLRIGLPYLLPCDDKLNCAITRLARGCVEDGAAIFPALAVA